MRKDDNTPRCILANNRLRFVFSFNNTDNQSYSEKKKQENSFGTLLVFGSFYCFQHNSGEYSIEILYGTFTQAFSEHIVN